eukprot:TRINITY_DN24199_c0_g1_i1.p1 TRINITY_DN24199_c0_g1~~TRINITY_DN24199_c0_g1_i1.p1  ORF type:complete len:454 (-),score=72.43 TRINITY_DN24199_c0_g1_i1:22-1383(-)
MESETEQSKVLAKVEAAYKGYGIADSHALKPLAQSSDEKTKRSAIFSIKEGVGKLSECLAVIKDQQMNMSRIESRPSAKRGYVDFFVDFSSASESEIKTLSELLVSKGDEISMVSDRVGTVWFPRKMKDLDSFSVKSLEYGEVLDADHPGFKDDTYRVRRKEITEKAKVFRYGQILPDVEYTQAEKDTWKTVYSKLKELFPTHACRQFNQVFPLLEQECGYGPDSIPQIRVISEFLHDRTGWRLRPVTGLLTPRDFLNALAFRVFHSTQYIRHASLPLYTPEPDVCHELIGHVPLLADPEFADFSQEIGLASLGASDADIEKLATVYWFTVEFGLCKEGENLKAYGAGLLSSFGELSYCLTGKAKNLPFLPQETAVTKYPITSYQPLYFVTESFEAATLKVREFAKSLDRPFAVRYNALTENVEILDKKDSLLKFVKNIQGDLKLLLEAIEKY